MNHKYEFVITEEDDLWYIVVHPSDDKYHVHVNVGLTASQLSVLQNTIQVLREHTMKLQHYCRTMDNGVFS